MQMSFVKALWTAENWRNVGLTNVCHKTFSLFHLRSQEALFIYYGICNAWLPSVFAGSFHPCVCGWRWIMIIVPPTNSLYPTI